MAVGTEVAHPVSILDGVSKVSIAVSHKEGGAVGDSGMHVAAEAGANVFAASNGCSLTENHSSSLLSISEVCSDETLSVASPATSAEKVEMESSEAPIYIVPDYVPEYRSGGCAERGIRRSMEDAHVCVDNLEETLGTRGAFYGVFDGHDGEAAACYVKEHLLPFILRDVSFPTCVEDAVKNAYLELDKEFLEACRLDDSLSSGTTVLTALLQGRNLLVANAGDCRAVLCRKGQAVPMSQDHDPSSAWEKSRIESVGGYVVDGYVNGQVTVARAIGDWHMQGLKEAGGKGPLSALPDVKSLVLSEDDEFLLMGCDGLWEVFTNEGAISFARKQLQRHNDPELCSKELVVEALRRNSQDNVTVIVICFKADAPPPLVVLERRTTIRNFCLKKMLSVQKDIDIAQASASERRCVV
ncbi:probable protein phosphatase 2C 57 [Physcomitrium patens]|uniref:PPM-type phosphatase domain-containing protein n=1 Tax=Physcomitrium patens TaxID=3218 RepID=A0A2K1L9G4_PHYPA|nr:probable protein phosphatase 2C 57 [Physcomitrium patens]PNR62676.1 hypothetical protein PHYPA_001100 [Physcomitrium patens]|eukprot:XP_024382080.1 probable protein phosphatase 2C 57 [Physcomitrella patens]